MPASDPRPAATSGAASREERVIFARATYCESLTITSYRLRRINGGREVVVVTLEQSQLKPDTIFQNVLSSFSNGYAR